MPIVWPFRSGTLVIFFPLIVIISRLYFSGS